MPSPSASAKQRVELLQRLVRGESSMAEVCREHRLTPSEVEGWLDGLGSITGGDREAAGRAPPGANGDAARVEEDEVRFPEVVDLADLRTIVDTIPTLAWCASADGGAEFFNQRWLEYAGLSDEEARGVGWTRALHPEDIGRVIAEWQAIVATAKPGELEARLRRRDGEYRWFLFRATPSLDDRGRVVKWYGTNTDIETRKRGEETLRASERSFRLIVESIPGFLCTMSAAGEVEFANRVILEHLGTTLEELRNWHPFVHPEDLPEVIERWSGSVATGQPYEVEYRLRRADGVYRWTHVRGLALRDGDGRVVRWYLVLADTEDRKRAEETLRESERSLRMIFESIPGMITVHRPDGELEYVNERLLDLLGVTFEHLAKGWLAVTHPDDLAECDRAWQRSLATNEPMDVTLRMRCADGSYRWFHSRKEALLDDNQQVVRWFSLVWDIEERKKAQDALQASEQELRLVIDSFPGMVAVVRPDGHHEYANRRVLDFIGSELSDFRWRDQIHPEERQAVVAAWLHSARTGDVLDVTYRLRRHDGDYRWVHSRSTPRLDEHGKILRWYGLMVDVDDQKRAEEALRASQAQLAHLTRVMTVGELAASIAHEVNQPLSAVVNNANACLALVPEDAPYLAEVRDALDDIVADADRAATVIGRVRQLVRKTPFEVAPLDLRDVVRDVLALAYHESIARRVAVRPALADDLPLVRGDRVQLQQVLLNLVVNAMDAMGTVAEPLRDLEISTRRETRRGEPHVVVRVRDAGCGFAPDEAERLFDAFYSTKPDGMGMGLAISRSIVSAHGGRLWAEANDGPGATFAFDLPAMADAAS